MISTKIIFSLQCAKLMINDGKDLIILMFSSCLYENCECTFFLFDSFLQMKKHPEHRTFSRGMNLKFNHIFHLFCDFCHFVILSLLSVFHHFSSF
jgi:hypothetical protein